MRFLSNMEEKITLMSVRLVRSDGAFRFLTPYAPGNSRGVFEFNTPKEVKDWLEKRIEATEDDPWLEPREVQTSF